MGRVPSIPLGTLRLVACVVVAALWLAVSYAATYAAYQLSAEIEDCVPASGRPIAVEGGFPWLKHTCVYQRFRETRVGFASRRELKAHCSGRGRGTLIDQIGSTPRYVCVRTSAVGQPFRGKSHYAQQIAVLSIGVIVGVVPAAALLGIGLGRPGLRRRRTRASAPTSRQTR